MRLAVMSDTHDNIYPLRMALKKIKAADCEMILHCGDFVAPFMLAELETAGVPVHGVFGNNDGDQYLLTKHTLTIHKNITLHGWFGRITADGRRIALMHDGAIAEDLAASDNYDLICYGHFHIYNRKMIGNTLVLNPGEMLGKDSPPGFCLVDTRTLDVEHIVLKTTGD
jgi:uncharacterized protein